jgi:DNA-binding NarL/FixJ family response regulator
MQPPLRILIADDHALFRQGLRSLLALRKGVLVVGEAERVDQVLALLEQTQCDLLLLDLGMERSALFDVRDLARRTRVLVVTANERPEDAMDAIRSGARGVVYKRFAVETLMDAIRAVAEGHVWMPPSLQEYAIRALPSEKDRNPLTPREREVVRHVALGLRNAEVAGKLFISEQTVKTHLNNVFQKLGIRDRVELTLYAARAGIISLHDREDGSVHQ